jgi:vancomycin permeability regulator SanA
MDHAGLSTYESMERAKKIFLVEHPIIVTQAYHLYRAIYLADSVGMNSIGADATLQDYDGQSGRDVREILARSKDFFSAMFQPNMYYGGDQIPISGNGNVTND